MSGVTWSAIRAGMASLGLAVSSSSTGAQARCVDLLVDQTRSVGQVCVTDRNDTLFVRFQAADGWHLAETHLAIGASREEIPLAAGRHPVLGRFPFKDEHAPGVEEFGYAIPARDLPSGAGATLVLAAHATVVRPGAEEGAWAGGTPFAPEGNPASYFHYRRSGASSPSRVSGTHSVTVAGVSASVGGMLLKGRAGTTRCAGGEPARSAGGRW